LQPLHLYLLEEGQPLPRRQILQRLFSRFPSGRPGLGLLLLRAAVGLTAIIQGGVYLAEGAPQTLGTWAVGLLAVASGAALLIGFLTPVAGALAGLISAGVALSWFPAPTANLFDARLSVVFVIIMAAAIVLLGPGAFSLDARLFGRREIIIPHASRLPKP
jgi:uncharacterized membrane protein YphA (DoxX/SURF4 family)